MTLPAPKTPIYTTTLPSSGEKIKYRPWDGVMEKSLLTAMMDDNKDTIRNTMLSVINACTFEELDVENLPDVDVDWLITKLRIHSVGEIVELTATCGNCNKEYDIKVDLSAATIIDDDKDLRKKPIQIDDDIYLTLNLPTREALEKYNDSNVDFDINHLIASMIKTISTSEQVFSPKDYSKEELVKYVSQFRDAKLKGVYDYLAKMPKVVTDTKSVCKHCKTTHDIHLEGAEFFFG